jgi:hypothetical protein
MRDHGGGLWTVDMPLQTAGMHLGARMTLVTLEDERLLLHSPVAFSDEIVKQIAALGEVAFVVAPNLIHYKYVPEAKARFPKARVLAVPGLREKKPDMPWDGVLAPGSDELPGVKTALVRGAPKLGEVMFLHQASKTMIATDFVFHYPEPKGWLFRFYLSLTRSVGVPAQTLIMRNMVKDRAALKQTRSELLAWDFERLFMAHGEPIQSGGKAALEKAMSWL